LQAAIQLGKIRAHDQAVPRLAELVEDHVRVYGQNHHETLRARHVHAMWTGRHGKRSRALGLFTGSLADRIRVQGPDHPNVLSTRFQIAVWTSGTGNPARAVELFTELLTDSIRVLGDRHPHTASIHYRLRLAARLVGRYDLAAEHLEIVRAEWIRRRPRHTGPTRPGG
jgi:hypothetical protein